MAVALIDRRQQGAIDRIYGVIPIIDPSDITPAVP
jgi:hypothetical protein